MPILFPISTREAAYNSLEITSTDGYDWSPYGKERTDELKMIENSTFYYQLKTNLFHSCMERNVYQGQCPM